MLAHSGVEWGDWQNTPVQAGSENQESSPVRRNEGPGPSTPGLLPCYRSFRGKLLGPCPHSCIADIADWRES